MPGRKINTTFLFPHRAPSKVICLAYNYWSLRRGDLYSSAGDKGPLIFLKPDTSIIGPGENIILRGHTNYAWPEVELAVICQSSVPLLDPIVLMPRDSLFAQFQVFP